MADAFLVPLGDAEEHSEHPHGNVFGEVGDQVE
jgi:hypothetical protein